MNTTIKKTTAKPLSRSSSICEPVSLKPGSKKFIDYKANLCQQAVDIKFKIDKLADKYSKIKNKLLTVFQLDPKKMFVEGGFVQLEQSNSYSIEEQNLEKAKEVLLKNNLVIDDYILCTTKFGITAKLRALVKDEASPIGLALKPLVTIKTQESLQVKS